MEDDIEVTLIHTVDISAINAEWLQQLTLEDLYLFMEYCEVQRGNSAAARARKVATLKSFFKYLKGKRRLIEDNPAEQLEAPKLGKKTPVYLNLQEAEQFINATSAQAYAARDYCIVMFFLNLGIRVSELCALNVTSIQGKYVTVVGKGNKERTIFMNDRCVEALDSYLPERHHYKGQGEEPLFVSQKGTRFARQSIAKIIKKLNNNTLQKQKLTPHKLRHTSATLMYRAGADIRSLQHILGHSSVATTQIYTHIEDEQIQQVMDNHPLNKKTNFRREDS